MKNILFDFRAVIERCIEFPSLFQSDSGSGSIVELSDEDMDYNYVAENILTNTDHFLESKISGQFRTWHLIFFTSLGTLVAGR